MIAVLYRVILKHGRETEFQEHWRTLTHYYIGEKGSLGSCLHKTEENLWIAYSRWPNKDIRDASWPGHGDPQKTLPLDIQETIKNLKSCVEVEFPETVMELVDDTMNDPVTLTAQQR